MSSYPYLDNPARLEALARYQITGGGREAAFDSIIDVAKRIFRVPVVLISFLDQKCQWVKAATGFSGETVNLQHSFCVQTIRKRGVNVILDVSEADERNQEISSNPSKRFRFYAGVSLTTTDGHNIGTLCLIDTVPHRRFSFDDEATLIDFAALIVRELELKITVEKLHLQTERTTKILTSIAEAAYFLDREWHFRYLNNQAENLLHRSETDLLGKEVWAEFPETEGSILYQKYFQAMASSTPQIFEYYYAPLQGWFDVHAYPSDDGLWVYFQDISERKNAMQKAVVQAEFRSRLLEFTQSSLNKGLDINFYQRLVDIAVATIPAAQAGSLLIKKESRSEFVAAVGFDLDALKAIDIGLDDEYHFSLSQFEPQLVRKWDLSQFSQEGKRVMNEEGRVQDIQASLCVPIEVDGQHSLTLCLYNFDSPDAFDEEAIEMTRILAHQAATINQRLTLDETLRTEREELKQLALYDQLTRLPNRTLFNDCLSHNLIKHDIGKSFLAVLFLDLDNFKEINDGYGHDVGDALIKEVSSCLKEQLRKEDLLARWGGDEFVLLLPNLRQADEAVVIAERLRNALRRPISVSGLTLHTSASIGVTFHTTKSQRGGDLLRQADTALYEAKTVKDRICVFNPEMTERVRQRMELSADLRTAIKHGEITLDYQPRIRLSDRKVTSVEALARWKHPKRGQISPSIFIPLAEEIGLIERLGQCILEMACEQAAAWRDEGFECRVAVNLSVKQLKQNFIVDDIVNILRANNLAPELLELEITESDAMADIKDGAYKLARLRDVGVYLSIDDFGTAYSSLSYLQRLPIQSLKIDQSFVRDIIGDTSRNTSDMRVVMAIISLAKSLRLNVVAEGVETEIQRQILQSFGCDEAQGYLFARPVPPDKLATLVQLPLIQTLKDSAGSRHKLDYT